MNSVLRGEPFSSPLTFVILSEAKNLHFPLARQILL
jgi:hypothetical protein